VLGLLSAGTVHVLGRMPGASNETHLCAVAGSPAQGAAGPVVRAVLKTRAGERALPDFPAGTLSHREVAAFEVSHALGLDVVPPTVWRSDLGGSLQIFVETDPAADPAVVLAPPGGLPRDLAPVLRAELAGGGEVVLAHALTPAVRRIAFFDVLIDNADRKGGHLLTGAWLAGDGPHEVRVHGIDNGLAFNTVPTLRTVLWGYAGEPLTDEERHWASRTAHGELDAVLAPHLGAEERRVLALRAAALLRRGRMPEPPQNRRAVPWPPL
jgi:uncharacterized repeat protein (TIGR03843 family)